jgi:hypothetical protein
MRMSLAHRRRVAPILVAALVPLLACSSDDDDNPVAPEPATLDASGTIGPAGGTITSDDGRLVLTVPAGALAADTEIVIIEATAKDLAVTGEGMDVRHALTMEPADLELAVPMTLELQYDVLEAGDVAAKEPEIRYEVRVEIAVVAVDGEGGETVRALPEQRIDLGPAGSAGKQEIVLSFIPSELVLGTPVAEVEGEVVATTRVGLGDEVPASAVEGTQFTAQVVMAYSNALALAGDAYLGQAALVNLLSLLDEGGVIDLQEVLDPSGWIKQYALLAYVAGAPGPATWNLNLRAEFDLQAAIAFPDAQTVPLVLGALTMAANFAPVNLAIQQAGGDPVEIGPGIYYLAALVEAGHPIRAFPGFPYNNTLAVGTGDGTGIYSLGADTPLAQAYTGFLLNGLAIWSCMLVGLGDKAADPASIAVVQAGPTGASLTQWFPEDNAFGFTGFIETQSSVTDAQPIAGDPLSGGFVMVRSSDGAVSIVEYNPESGFYDLYRQIRNFPEAPGTPFTAAVRPGAGAVVVTDGSPGKIYHHDLANLNGPATPIGDAGNAPRRIRTAGNLAFVSNFESDELTILGWTPEGTVTVIGSVSVGDGPVGIDALELPGGNVAVVSTGFNDDTSTVTIVDAAGAVVSSTTTSLPAGGLAPGHAFWLRGEATHYGVTCNESGHLVVIDPGLD